MKMYVGLLWLLANVHLFATANELMGCGGFLKSHVQIDFSKVLIKLVTKQGVVKDQTNCAPKTGYYFIPLYDKGDYVLQLEPPPGWSFTPNQFQVSIDGKTDMCSIGKDINFVFKGFGIAGKVESFGSTANGPAGIDIKLIAANGQTLSATVTDSRGVFFFTPVYPGQYQVVAAHKKWSFVNNQISVTVKEENTELPSGSLVISGYDATGLVQMQSVGVQGAKVLIFSQNQNAKVQGCDTSVPVAYQGAKPICVVATDKDGVYVFPSVSPGKYSLVAYMGPQVHLEPQSVDFEVVHDSLKVEQTFQVVGLSVSGFVRSGDRALGGVVVILDDRQQVVTKADGSYTLEQVRPGMHSVTVRADDHKFATNSHTFTPTSVAIPVITPSAYKVCGTVISDKMEAHSVTMTKMGSTTHVVAKSDANTGEFCEFLPGGKYQVQVLINDKALQFFPVVQTVEVFAPVANIVFSQLKVTVSGKVKCINQDDCKRLKVIMRPVDKADELIANVIDGKYTVSDMRPGGYRIALSSNRLCWEHVEHTIQVSNATSEAPTFVNTGYAVTFISTHATTVSYDGQTVAVGKGTSQHCVPQPGSYRFQLDDSCHQYETNAVDYQTSQEPNEILLSAVKHKVTIDVEAKQHLGDVFILTSVDNGVKTLQGPLVRGNGKYTLAMYLARNENAILTPQSDSIFFNPPILSVDGAEDCAQLGVQFVAKKGKVFSGKVTPALKGVQILVETEGSSDTLSDETDAEGQYKFPPLDDGKSYTVSASKQSYVLIGPDAGGDFVAQKLAEIIVEVRDRDTGEPLQGTLVSLSGAESYRSNMQTGDDGTITFPSLSPSEYFLKPMMKEYSFEPASKTVNVLVGVSVRVVLKGKRVAYSAYGQVTTLNNQPEKQMVVVARGLNNCSHLAEEATTEASGLFRIRGLVPHCSYKITVRASLQENDIIERVLPKALTVDNISEDLSDLRLIVFRPSSNMDVYVKVYTPNAEHYRALRLKVTRESAPGGLVHNLRVDNYKVSADNNVGILLPTPPIPMDGKVYSLQLESTNGAVRGKSTLKSFTADSSYKFVELEFAVQSGTAEQHIKQVSLWTLLLIFAMMVAAYNVDKIVEMLKAHVNVNLPFSLAKPKTATPEHYHMDNAEIEKIVENINAPKKKVKSKRV